MPPQINIIGLRYGKLIVVKQTKTIKKVIYYLCKCDCGNQRGIRGLTLRAGQSKSCGCDKPRLLSDAHLIDLTGKKFGIWSVVSRAPNHAKINKPMWFCKCECGRERAVLAASLMAGTSKSCGCQQYKIGKHNCAWKGGRQITRDGYVVIWDPHNPMAHRRGYVFEHRAKMAMRIGRPLLKNESVHHKNGIRSDNRLSNLELWVKPQVPGQRASDLLAFANEIIQTYGGLKI